MTLIVGIVCSDGLVMAADSASTDSESGVKQPVEKIRRLGTHPMLYGASGDVGLAQKVEYAIEGYAPGPSMAAIRKALRTRILPELQDAVRSHVQFPQQGFHTPPVLILAFGGVLKGKAWLLEVERDGRDTHMDERLGGFLAIGSGKPWAQALFRPYLKNPRDLALGKLFAFRVMRDSIDLAAGGLADPITIWTIDSQGAVSTVGGDELVQLGNTLQLWREAEQEALGAALRPRAPAPEPIPDVPAPQENTGAPDPEPLCAPLPPA